MWQVRYWCAHIYTHKETETQCDRRAEPFSCGLFQRFPLRSLKICINQRARTHTFHCVPDKRKKKSIPLINVHIVHCSNVSPLHEMLFLFIISQALITRESNNKSFCLACKSVDEALSSLKWLISYCITIISFCLSDDHLQILNFPLGLVHII